MIWPAELIFCKLIYIYLIKIVWTTKQMFTFTTVYLLFCLKEPYMIILWMFGSSFVIWLMQLLCVGGGCCMHIGGDVASHHVEAPVAVSQMIYLFIDSVRHAYWILYNFLIIEQ